jgi:hypothetical protein
MSLRARSILTVTAVAALGQLGFASQSRAWDEPTRAIAANSNDPGITTARGANLIYLNADPARRVGKLLVFLPSGGATNLPTEFKEIGTESGRLGYHPILLAYRNEAPIAAPPPAGCGNTVEASPTFPNPPRVGASSSTAAASSRCPCGRRS